MDSSAQLLLEGRGLADLHRWSLYRFFFERLYLSHPRENILEQFQIGL